ncbi:TnpV protein [Clostridium sp. OM04-7]|nr:TnpV protein [Clostridium sp. OM04-7]
MAKSLFEELGGKYERQGDYLIPCLTVPAEEEQAIGIWGQRHLDYLKQYRKVTYTNLLTSGRLNAYLADINRQAQERFERLIEGMKQAQGITEQLKAENALEWTGCLNNINASHLGGQFVLVVGAGDGSHHARNQLLPCY